MDSNLRQIRDAWRELCMHIEPNAVMTLGAGLGLSAISFEGQARRLFNALQREARGRNWHTYSSALWPIAIGFIEEGANRPHMHLAVRLPKDANLRAAFQFGGSRWGKIRKGGDYFFQFADDRPAYISYITKHFHRPITAEHSFIYAPRAKGLEFADPDRPSARREP